MKARTFILSAGAAFALAVPAANAAIARNGLYQAQVHTVLAEQSVGKSQAGKNGKASTQLSAAVTRALRIRGDALNREYHLGLYAKKGFAGKSIVSVAVPAAPGTGVPIGATTSDDYDNPEVLYGSPASGAAPAASSSSDVSQTPSLIDGYLLQ